MGKQSGYPDVHKWLETYVLHPPSDLDALVAFGERDGRLADWND